jgi:hypothetical protein
MANAYHEINEIRRQHGRQCDLRTAAFICSINKIVGTYAEMGIFP